MQYENITLGRFLARPNRFIAQVEIEGEVLPCHIKNTSRLTELLVPGVRAAVQRANTPNRKTPYSLIAVEHEGEWANIDSQAPNQLFGEWLRQSEYLGPATLIRPETTWGSSRFDYYVESGGRRIFVEIKGVTLVEEGIARFPGAPTVRGVKHLRELVACQKEGYDAMLALVVKRNAITACGPNDALDPAFGAALREAAQQGVRLLGLGCTATESSIAITRFVDIVL